MPLWMCVWVSLGPSGGSIELLMLLASGGRSRFLGKPVCAPGYGAEPKVRGYFVDGDPAWSH